MIPHPLTSPPPPRVSLGHYQGQDKPVAGRFAGPGKNQGIFLVGRIDESGGEKDGADPGVKLEKEAGQGGTGRDVEAAGGAPGVRENSS